MKNSKKVEIHLPKVKRKGIIRTILDNYRDVAMYERAITEIMYTICIDPHRNIMTYDNKLLSCLTEKVSEMSIRLKKLEHSQNNIQCDDN